MINTPTIVHTTAQPTAIIRLTIPREEVRNVMGPTLRELRAAIADEGIAPAGPWFTHHLRMDPDIFDFEISVPVDTAPTPVGRVVPSELPAMKVARTVYEGPYEGLGEAWEEFGEWIAAQGHSPAPDLWEVYLTDPSTDPDATTWRTQLNRPIQD